MPIVVHVDVWLGFKKAGYNVAEGSKVVIMVKMIFLVHLLLHSISVSGNMNYLNGWEPFLHVLQWSLAIYMLQEFLLPSAL